MVAVPDGRLCSRSEGTDACPVQHAGLVLLWVADGGALRTPRVFALLSCGRCPWFYLLVCFELLADGQSGDHVAALYWRVGRSHCDTDPVLPAPSTGDNPGEPYLSSARMAAWHFDGRQ